MRAAVILVPALLSLLVCPSARSADRVLWRNEGHDEATFIAATELANPDSPLPAAVLAPARRRLRQIVAAKGSHLPCVHAAESGAGGDSSGWLSLTDKIRKGLPVFLGEVVKSDPGWSPLLGYTVSLVHVRVREVLSGGPGLKPGAELSYLQEAGTFTLFGATLCTTNDPYHEARAGDRLVVLGFVDPINPDHLSTGAPGIYPVVGEKVIQPPPLPPGAEAAISLQAVREVARRPVR